MKECGLDGQEDKLSSVGFGVVLGFVEYPVTLAGFRGNGSLAGFDDFCRGGGLAAFLYTFRKKEKLLAWWCSLPGTAYVAVNICIATAVLMEVAVELLLRFR